MLADGGNRLDTVFGLRDHLDTVVLDQFGRFQRTAQPGSDDGVIVCDHCREPVSCQTGLPHLGPDVAGLPAGTGILR